MIEQWQRVETARIYPPYAPQEPQEAQQKTEAWLERIRGLYGDQVVNVERHTLTELYAAEGVVAYSISVQVELPEPEIICLPGGLMLAYETDQVSRMA